MNGYDVVTSEQKSVGKVFTRVGDWLVVERGLVRRSRCVLPIGSVAFDRDEERVRTTLSKETIVAAPRADKDGRFDRAAAAAYYGLDNPTGFESPGSG